MTTFEVKWGRQEPRQIATVTELDIVLSGLQDDRGDGDAPFGVSLSLADDSVDPFDKEVLSIGVGHPSRAFVFWAGHGGGWGYQPEIPEAPEPIAFDLGGQWTEYHPDETRILPDTAIAVAREFLATGKRPTIVAWDS